MKDIVFTIFPLVKVRMLTWNFFFYTYKSYLSYINSIQSSHSSIPLCLNMNDIDISDYLFLCDKFLMSYRMGWYPENPHLWAVNFLILPTKMIFRFYIYSYLWYFTLMLIVFENIEIFCISFIFAIRLLVFVTLNYKDNELLTLNCFACYHTTLPLYPTKGVVHFHHFSFL